MRYTKLFFLFLLVLLFACQSEKQEILQKRLEEAGKNREELEKVLEHYNQHPEDRLKLKAAEFLIMNMNNRFSYYSKEIMDLYNQMDSLQLLKEYNIFQFRLLTDSLFKNYRLDNLERIYDLETITADYLIHTIEQAFKAWESPLAEGLSFEGFCEYLLPYRLGTELLEDWRTDYKEFFSPVLADLDLTSDSVLYHLHDKLWRMYENRNYEYPVQMPDRRPSSLLHIRMGPCAEYVKLFTYLARIIGLPATSDFTPQWANHSQGHGWSAILYKGNTMDYVIDRAELAPGKHLAKFNNKMVKVYRENYGIQQNSVRLQHTRELLSPFFRNPYITDVTPVYMPVDEIRIGNLFPEAKGRKYIYLSVFDNKSWVPVAWGEIKRGNGVVKDVGRGAVFLPVCYNGIDHIPVQHPVILAENGEWHILSPDTVKTCHLRVKRKYLEYRARWWADDMSGGRFEVASDAAFSDPLVFLLPDTVDYCYQDLMIEGGKRYQYVRYLPAWHTTGTVSEIEVFNRDGDLLKGEVIGNYKNSSDDFHGMEKVFDGNILTYAACDTVRSETWLGLRFTEPVELSRISFLPRSDDNFIRHGEVYELFYWDKRWISLGRQTGDRSTQMLEYPDAPSNALYLLRNHTKGKEERIFTYEENRQVWW